VFLGYGVEESRPDRSSLSVIRHRPGPEIHQGLSRWCSSLKRRTGFLRGQHLEADSSDIEADASLRTLVHRNRNRAYREYVKELAAEEGVDPEIEGRCAASIRSDLDAGRAMKNGRSRNDPQEGGVHQGRSLQHGLQLRACDRLRNGVTAQAEILEADHADTTALNVQVACAVQVVNRIVANADDAVVRSLQIQEKPRGSSTVCRAMAGQCL
jgi:hypothetical protein